MRFLLHLTHPFIKFIIEKNLKLIVIFEVACKAL